MSLLRNQTLSHSDEALLEAQSHSQLHFDSENHLPSEL